MSWWGGDSSAANLEEKHGPAEPPPPTTSSSAHHSNLKSNGVDNSQSSSVDCAHPLFLTKLLPLDESIERTRNCWSDPPPSRFSVRGKNYLVDRKKIIAPRTQYSLLGMDVLHRASGGVRHVAPRKAVSLQNAREKGFTGFVLILNFVLSDINLICYWTPQRNILSGKKGKRMRRRKSKLKDYLTGHDVFDGLMEKFVEGDDTFRNNRLKIIPMMVKGNWLLSQVVSGKPAILCNKIKTSWYRDLSPHQNYLEADIDIQSSQMAMGILGLVKFSAHTVALDMAFTIEGKDILQLPEEILCALRFHHLEPDNAPDWCQESFIDDREEGDLQDQNDLEEEENEETAGEEGDGKEGEEESGAAGTGTGGGRRMRGGRSKGRKTANGKPRRKIAVDGRDQNRIK